MSDQRRRTSWKVTRGVITGSEFAEHRQVAHVVSAATYFCDPYRPSQRETNENTNGLIRQYFPTGTDLSGYSQEEHLELETAHCDLPMIWHARKGSLNLKNLILI